MMELSNVMLPSSSPSGTSPPPTYTVTITNHKVTSIRPSSPTKSAGRPPPTSLLLPPLCHPHIHLDKAYLLTSHYCPPYTDQQVEYSDLAPKDGTFPEALKFTSQAKSRFTPADLRLRGRQLLATAYTQGVTSARCFVEVDHVVGHMTLEAGLDLKREFEDEASSSNTNEPQGPVKLVRIQLCAFAQDPIFSTEHGDTNRHLMEEALSKHAATNGIEVLGTTPYVETTRSAAEQNVDWAINTALQHNLHLDFHTDYNLDSSKAPEDLMVWYILERLIFHKWPPTTSTPSPSHPHRTVTLGHATALTLLPSSHLTRLATLIHSHALPVAFIGLPTSDLYMMGRPSSSDNDKPQHRPRGTLNPLSLLSTHPHPISAALGANNVGNAFTSFGVGDPLQLASFGVGLYHGGTERDAWALYGCVSWGARRAVGLELPAREGEEGLGDGEVDGGRGGRKRGDGAEGIREGQDIGEFGLLLVRNEEFVGCPGKLGMMVPARQRWGVRDVVWDVPEVGLRRVLR